MRLVFSALIGALSVSGAHVLSQAKTLAIEHVTIIDGTGAPAKADMTVVVVGNHIKSTVAGEADARRAVDNLKAQGVDFIKVGDRVPRDVYFAIADESKRQGPSLRGARATFPRRG